MTPIFGRAIICNLKKLQLNNTNFYIFDSFYYLT